MILSFKEKKETGTMRQSPVGATDLGPEADRARTHTHSLNSYILSGGVIHKVK